MPTRRTAPPRRATILAAVALVLAACSTAGPGASGGAAPESAGPSTRPGTSVGPRPTVGPTSSPVTGEVPDAVMTAVQADLSAKTGQDATTATVTMAQAVTWPDGSLGCPQPGIMYTQMVQPGYRVVLELDGKSYDYRVAGEGTTIRLCEGVKPAGY
jgi:hypothetical protein